MTHYVFHYDLESERCVQAAPVLAEIHRRHETPATFFIVGRILERFGDELKAVFGDDRLFDLQSHTYSHRLLKDNQMHGPGVSLEDLRVEIGRGVQLVEETFGRACIGVRSGCGFFKGMQGERERLQVIWDCGVKYLSSDLRSHADSIPSGLQQAYWYDEEGFPELLELPGHGWHDNVLKSFQPRLFLAWPPALAWGIPNRPTTTPEEERIVQATWLDKAISLGLDFVSLVYHPHSIYGMSEDCRVAELLVQEVKARGMPVVTYTQLYQRYAAAPESVPGRDAWRWDEGLQDKPFQMLRDE